MDERTEALENAGYKWVYTLVSFRILLDVVYRGPVRDEAAWELLALAIVGGFVCTAYQIRQDALPKGWGFVAIVIACIAGAIGFVMAAFLQ